MERYQTLGSLECSPAGESQSPRLPSTLELPIVAPTEGLGGWVFIHRFTPIVTGGRPWRD